MDRQENYDFPDSSGDQPNTPSTSPAEAKDWWNEDEVPDSTTPCEGQGFDLDEEPEKTATSEGNSSSSESQDMGNTDEDEENDLAATSGNEYSGSESKKWDAVPISQQSKDLREWSEEEKQDAFRRLKAERNRKLKKHTEHASPEPKARAPRRTCGTIIVPREFKDYDF
ncbi:uncharacterized protein LOC108025682 [Drosophila biarmipes]|uniref:uncharacterized protein LOC108025682 n=1 Tax=Drosophila biarmipes TaxID=125945 RepID=UPI0007E6D6EA|nr:uncharacterized protein LOC108025682 [Drosophila biarmipes]